MSFATTFIRSRALAGSRFFGALSAVMIVVKILRRLGGTGPKTLHRHELKDGEVLVISDSPKR